MKPPLFHASEDPNLGTFLPRPTPPGGPPLTEPSVWAMMLAGFAVLGGALRFRRSRELGAAV